MGYMKISGSDESLVSRPVKKVQKVHRLMLPLEEQQKQPKKDKGQHSASLGR